MAKKKNSLFKIIAIPVIVLAVAGVTTYFFSWYLNKPRFVRYAEFGIDIPVNYAIHGIDVSHHNGNIDWKAVKDMQVKNIKMGFAFIKATEGLGRTDGQFRKNWEKAREAKVPRGAYHFFIASKSGKAQAENFIATVQLEKGDLPPVLDVETDNGVPPDILQQRVKDWLQLIEEHYKIKPIIYTYVEFYDYYLGEKFNGYPLWAAHYLIKDKPRIKRNWIFWQHNDNGRVNGISAAVDFNVFNGDSADFKTLLVH